MTNSIEKQAEYVSCRLFIIL